VPDLAVDALTLFRSTAYRDTTFKIIDFLSPVLDSTIEARLDEALVAAIRGGTDVRPASRATTRCRRGSTTSAAKVRKWYQA